LITVGGGRGGRWSVICHAHSVGPVLSALKEIPRVVAQCAADFVSKSCLRVRLVRTRCPARVDVDFQADRTGSQRTSRSLRVCQAGPANDQTAEIRVAHANGKEFTTRFLEYIDAALGQPSVFHLVDRDSDDGDKLRRGHIGARHVERYGKSGIVQGVRDNVGKVQHVQPGHVGFDEDGQDHGPSAPNYLLPFHFAGRHGLSGRHG
jgi:hypothetical protein